jgi:hypothetical protein
MTRRYGHDRQQYPLHSLSFYYGDDAFPLSRVCTSVSGAALFSDGIVSLCYYWELTKMSKKNLFSDVLLELLLIMYLIPRWKFFSWRSQIFVGGQFLYLCQLCELGMVPRYYIPMLRYPTVSYCSQSNWMSTNERKESNRRVIICRNQTNEEESHSLRVGRFFPVVLLCQF